MEEGEGRGGLPLSRSEKFLVEALHTGSEVFIDKLTINAYTCIDELCTIL